MAAIKINFDSDHNPLVPTFILGDRMGNKFGIINNVCNINISDKMNNCPEVSFTVYKYYNEERSFLWDKIQNLMTVYCPEWKTWFEMSIDLSDESDILKNVILMRIAEAELSQLYLYELEANTEDDLDLKEIGKSTILYNPNDKSCSLLHRILDKAPHYSIDHVDSTIANEQREFSFDKTTIRDAFNQISEELNCLFVYNTSDEDGNLIRTISVYDLENNCLDCKHRGEFSDTCPECGSTNIKRYGKDTNIYVTSDGLGSSVKLTIDKDSIKNCFKLEAGDEIITDTVKLCTPNNSLYLWNFSNYTKSIMPKELVDKLNKYDAEYNAYNKTHAYSLGNIVNSYNDIINKYNDMLEKEELKRKQIQESIVGYSNLIDIYYDAIDMKLYLESELMPSIDIDETTAQEQLNFLLENISTISVEDVSSITKTTAKSAVLSMAKVLVDGRYQVEIDDEFEYNSSTNTWTGKFIITNISDEEETVTGKSVEVKINDDYESFIKEKINKMLNDDTYDTSISWLFDLEKCNLETFTTELKKYGLNSLSNFHDSCNACIDLMIEQKINEDKNSSEYKTLAKPYQDRLKAISTEITTREKEIEIIENIQGFINDMLNKVHAKLNIVTYMGDLYPILCSYIREDEYSNSNYISDGLSNTEIVEKAKEFILKAEKELYKASNLQHTISADIKNLLTIKEFEPLINQFECGNWIHVRVDEEVFKLRLLEYEINYDDHTLNVIFSDVSKIFDGITDLKSIIEQASSMAGSYDSFKSQMNKVSDKTKHIDNWVSEGIDITNVSLMSNSYNQNIFWDKSGLLCREIDPLTGEYGKDQLKIITNGLYLTDNYWETSKTGIGKFNFYNPISKQTETRYGVVADAIVGNLILSETVGIYNKSNNIILNHEGLIVKNSDISVIINPNDEYDSIFTIKNQGETVLSMTKDGGLYIVGRIAAGSEVESGTVKGLSSVATSGKYSDLSGKPDLSKYLTSDHMSVYISKDGVVGTTPSDGATGFKVSSSGLLEASNAIIYGSTISGNIIASSGKIGGFTIAGPKNITNGFWNWSLSSIVNTNASTVDTSNPQYVAFMRGQSDDGKSGAISPENVVFGVKKRTSTGTTWNDASYMFYVKANGSLYANNANIKGTITGSTITGSTITSHHELSSTDLPMYAQLSDGKIYLKGEMDEFFLTFDTRGRIQMNTPWFDCSYIGDGKDIIMKTGFQSLYTDTLTTNSIIFEAADYTKKTGIKTISGDSNGLGISIGAGGLVVIGAGESANNFIEDEGKTGTSEHLFLTSDGNIYLVTKCNTITERIALIFTNTGILRPTVTKEWSIGSGTYKFNEGNFETVFTSGGTVSKSDARTKKDFSDLPNPEDFIMSLKPMQYKYINGDSNRYHWGFVAQDVKKSLDNICQSDCGLYVETILREDDVQKSLSEYSYSEKELALRYEEFIAPHIHVTQLHNKKINELEKEVQSLKEIIKSLKS